MTSEKTERGVSFLKALRELLGDISQEELARRIGVSLNSVSRWERGITPATFTVPQLKAFVLLVQSVDLDVEQIPDDLTLHIQPKKQSAEDA